MAKTRGQKPVATATPETVTVEPVDTNAEDTSSGKVRYPVPADDKKFKLDPKATEFKMPEDYDPEKHRPLNKIHFADEPSFLVYRAIKAEAAAKQYREDAVNWETTGKRNKEIRKAKRLRNTVDDIVKSLKAGGMTDEQIAVALGLAKEGGDK